MYNTADICHLDAGSYTIKVDGIPVSIDSGGNVKADKNAKATCFSVQKFVNPTDPKVCTYVIWYQNKFAEYQDGGDYHIDMSGGNTPRNWTITQVSGNTYYIQPGPPSKNAWTIPGNAGGKVYLSTLTNSNEQKFTFTKC